GLSNLRQMVMYNCHPGGLPERGFRGYGGFKTLEAYTPTLAKMDVGLVWLLPIWEHGDGEKWNLYAPFDHFRVSHLYGTPDELKELSATFRKQGIRLMFDLVPHGPPDFTPLAQAHPEWICLDAQGKRVYAWGQYAFDNNHPGWQASMRRAAAWGAREFGAIGCRVDCGAGGPLNWNRAVGDRPSLSSLAAGLGMNRAIRQGYLDVQPEVVVLPEEYTGANIFYRVSDLTYDAQFYFLQSDLHARHASPEEWAESIQTFLHDQQLTLPPGALKMRWISNHDTVSWTFQKARPIKLYGVEKTRALLALCAFVEGVPMLFQGDEDPSLYGGQGPSSVDVLAKFYHLRKRLAALRAGSADYAAIHASDGVFACLRKCADSQAVILISLNPQGVETALAPPALLRGTWTDELSGESLTLHARPRLPMAPYQVRVLTRSDTGRRGE
ncbi:MAG: alpha-amylase family glycosyl hydrolase, partial [Isosphaeraceae bacterium]